MPALYALGQHSVLVEANAQLHDGELLFAFLGDVYVLCAPERVGAVFDILTDALERRAGVR
eukprot:12338598-Alexandrium_andersonii.AAC.1